MTSTLTISDNTRQITGEVTSPLRWAETRELLPVADSTGVDFLVARPFVRRAEVGFRIKGDIEKTELVPPYTLMVTLPETNEHFSGVCVTEWLQKGDHVSMEFTWTDRSSTPPSSP